MTDREKLAARLNVMLRAIVGPAAPEVTPDRIHRTHAGRHMRAEGTGSWATIGHACVGSTHTMRECLRGVVTLRFDGCSWWVDPAEETAPAGAPFGHWRGREPGRGAERPTIWYDAAGKPLGTSSFAQIGTAP